MSAPLLELNSGLLWSKTIGKRTSRQRNSRSSFGQCSVDQRRWFGIGRATAIVLASGGKSRSLITTAIGASRRSERSYGAVPASQTCVNAALSDC